jgi:hypothetical protein
LGCGDLQGFKTEALDGGENVVGGFGPFERLWVGVDRVSRWRDWRTVGDRKVKAALLRRYPQKEHAGVLRDSALWQMPGRAIPPFNSDRRPRPMGAFLILRPSKWAALHDRP